MFLTRPLIDVLVGAFWENALKNAQHVSKLVEIAKAIDRMSVVSGVNITFFSKDHSISWYRLLNAEQSFQHSGRTGALANTCALSYKHGPK